MQFENPKKSIGRELKINLVLPFSDRLIAEPGAKKVEDVYEPNPNEINATSVFRQLEFVTPVTQVEFFPQRSEKFCRFQGTAICTPSV